MLRQEGGRVLGAIAFSLSFLTMSSPAARNAFNAALSAYDDMKAKLEKR